MPRMSSVDQAAQTPPPGAVCSAHVDRPATVICARCGDFTCDECVGSAAEPVCAACQIRVGAPRELPFHQDNWTISGVFGHAWAVLSANFLPIFGVTWAGFIPYYAFIVGPSVVFAFSGPEAIQLMQTLPWRLGMQGVSTMMLCMAGPLLLGLYAYFAARVRGQRAGIGMLLGQLHRLRPYVALVLIQSLLGLPGTLITPFSMPQGEGQLPDFAQLLTSAGVSLVMSVYGIIVYTVMQFAVVELVVGDAPGGVQALKDALGHLRRRPAGAIFTALLTMVLTSISMMCCLFPVFVAVPFANLAFTTLYLSIRTPNPRSAS